MITLSLAELAIAAEGKLLVTSENVTEITVVNIITDSRALKAGEAFLALKGPNFDGHRFIEQVADLGCSVVIVDHEIKSTEKTAQLPQIVVADTRIALGKIGAYVKQKVAPKTVGITGSSGKTTVKEMVAAILSRLGNVLATKGNFNNDIGVPLTLLRLEESHDFAVIEMGANHLGEIAYTTNLVKPDVAIINNIAAAHLEGFGDLCGVARAKGEIYDGLSDSGIALYNLDTKFESKWTWRLENKTVRRFSCKGPIENSLGKKADVYSSNATLNNEGCATFTLHTPRGSTFIELTVPGKHNVCNAVAAAAIAIEFGASLEDIYLGLGQMSSVKGRLNIFQLTPEIKLIDDSYNANVESVKAATELLTSYEGKRILILGDMGELGSLARSYHQEVGEHAQTQGVDHILTLGVLSQCSSDAFNKLKGEATNDNHFSSREQLMSVLTSILAQQADNVSILVKGSRSAHMEKVVENIVQLIKSDDIQTDSVKNAKNNKMNYGEKV